MTKSKLKVGLIGCGAIGTVLAEAIERKIVVCDELVVYDFDASKAQKLKSTLNFPVTIVDSVDELLALKPKVIVEAASQQAAKDYVPKIVATGTELIVMSTGALLDLDVDLRQGPCSFRRHRRLRCSLQRGFSWDRRGNFDFTQKPQSFRSLNNKEEKIVYEGYAEEAARTFPTRNECCRNFSVNG